MNIDQLSVINTRFAFTAKHRINVYRTIAILIDKNVKMDEIFTALHEQYSMLSRKKEKHPVALIMLDISTRFSNGVSTLSELFEPWVPLHESMILRAGGNGNLNTVLNDLIESITIRQNIKSLIVQTSTYPFVLFSFCIGMLMMYAREVIPKLEQVSSVESWPLSSHILKGLSYFVNDYILFIAPAIVGIYVFFYLALPRWTYRFARLRVYLDNYPPFNIYRMLHGSSFLLSLSVMMNGGVRLEDALNTLESAAQPWLKERINAIIRNIGQGKNLGASMSLAEYDFPDKTAILFISLLSKASNGLTGAMYGFAKDWMGESLKKLKTVAAVSFVCCILFVGVFAALILFGQQGMSSAIISSY